MIYLCSVYSKHAKTQSFEDKELRQHRCRYAMKRVAEYLNQNIMVYSPIAHCHEMANHFELPKDYSFWREFDRGMINRADEVYVLKMPFWEQSEGITDELEYANEIGKKITYLDCPDYSEICNNSLCVGT